MTFWTKKRIRNIPKAQFVHVYVHGMNIWRPKFDAKRTQKYPKSALCTRIRARNAVLGTPFWPKTQPKMRQDCISYTYTCTECSFGDAILIKTQLKICQNCSSCTYTCTEWTFEATERKKKRKQIMKNAVRECIHTQNGHLESLKWKKTD